MLSAFKKSLQMLFCLLFKKCMMLSFNMAVLSSKMLSRDCDKFDFVPHPFIGRTTICTIFPLNWFSLIQILTRYGNCFVQMTCGAFMWKVRIDFTRFELMFPRKKAKALYYADHALCFQSQFNDPALRQILSVKKIFYWRSFQTSSKHE